MWNERRKGGIKENIDSKKTALQCHSEGILKGEVRFINSNGRKYTSYVVIQKKVAAMEIEVSWLNDSIGLRRTQFFNQTIETPIMFVFLSLSWNPDRSMALNYN